MITLSIAIAGEDRTEVVKETGVVLNAVLANSDASIIALDAAETGSTVTVQAVFETVADMANLLGENLASE